MHLRVHKCTTLNILVYMALGGIGHTHIQTRFINFGPNIAYVIRTTLLLSPMHPTGKCVMH